MKVDIQKTSGKVSGKKITLSDKIFSIEPNDHAIYLDVKSHLANKRQGTSKVKGRSEIIGSTRKIKKQKGTGTARAGSIKSGIFRGGGRIFGPQPRGYDLKLNKKLKKIARRSALTIKAKDKAITVLEDFEFDTWTNIDFTDDVLSDGRPQLWKGLSVETREAWKDYGDEENTALRLGG